ncbi:MAG: aldo/keto reductase [Betaproteobacteria bacterium]|nr:MAG: aldo/keto reductase [Betaproteobacteria bacterium]
MRYRTFGRTGLKVSELVFGGGWVGGVLIHQDDDTKLKVLRYAIDSGINWIDTASKYGNGKSEEALGWLLQELSRRPYVSTKVMLDTSNLDDVAGQVERSTNESLSRMKLDSVDLLQLHNPLGVAAVDPNAGGSAITAEHVLAKNGVADSLDRMREQGLTRYIGFTALGDVASCRRLIDSDRFDSVQVYYNMLNPSAARTMPGSWVGHDFGNLVAACKRQNMATMVIRVLAAGVLASDERHGREVVITRESGLDTESRRAAAVFAALGDEYGSRAQTALRFVLSNADVSCAVFGLAEFAHLREALAAADMGPLPQTAFDKLDQAYANNFNL